MHAPRWERFAAGCGVLFVGLAVAGFVVTAAGLPGSGASDAEVVTYYEDGDTELKRELGATLVGFAVFFFLLFLGSLRSAVGEVERARGTFASIAYAGGVTMAALMLVTGALEASIASADGYFENFDVDAGTAIFVQSLTYWLGGFELLAGGVMVGATSIIALKTGFLPRWLAIAGLVLAGIAFFGETAQTLIVPLLLVLLWTAIVSAILFRRSKPPALGRRGSP
jgi:hypothetical protein